VVRRERPATRSVYVRRRVTAGAGAVALVALLVVGLSVRGGQDNGPVAEVAVFVDDVTEQSTVPTSVALADEPADDCVIEATELTAESSSEDVRCLQTALVTAGFSSTSVDGVFSPATASLVRQFQDSEDLYVDGVVGRRTAIALNIWPEAQMGVIYTAAPAQGAVDLSGQLLSPVATAGDDAPPLPGTSGTGRRVVYSRDGQRIWAVDSQERIVRSYLVSGSAYNNEAAGTHEVFSRSEEAVAWNGEGRLPLMIRWYMTPRDNAIGFHGIPIHFSDGTPYQSVDQLGDRLSDGCQRQHALDAEFMWGFADIGTKVVVV